MSIATTAKTVHRESVVTSVSDVASFLQETLGQKLVAHMVGVSNPKTVGKWASGESAPRSAHEDALRSVHQISLLLLTKESRHTVRAWFLGMNPQLNDLSPANVIADGRYGDVLAAAKAFLAGG